MSFNWIPDFKDTFENQAHEKYLRAILKSVLAPVLGKYDPHKMLFLYCCIGGLKALGVAIDKDMAEIVIKFIEACEVEINGRISYAPSPFLRYPIELKQGDIITTYLAVSSTVMASGAIISEPKRSKIGQYIECVFEAKEASINIREMFAFCSTKKLLGLPIELSRAESIYSKVLEHQTYDGAFALEAESESHAAASFCAIACLKMIGRLSTIDTERVKRWALMRQVENGFSVD
jgi:prenyltransferase beta subunit